MPSSMVKTARRKKSPTRNVTLAPFLRDGRSYFMGIDPGANGGMCVLNEVGEVVCVESLSTIPQKILTAFGKFDCKSLTETDPIVYVFIEKVGGYMKRGGKSGIVHDTGSSMFSFGRVVGLIQMALTATGLDRYAQEVHPVTWQKSLGIKGTNYKGGETKADFKRRLRDRAAELFPDAPYPTLKTADAMLIAYYGLLTAST